MVKPRKLEEGWLPQVELHLPRPPRLGTNVELTDGTGAFLSIDSSESSLSREMLCIVNFGADGVDTTADAEDKF